MTVSRQTLSKGRFSRTVRLNKNTIFSEWLAPGRFGGPWDLGTLGPSGGLRAPEPPCNLGASPPNPL